MHKLLDKYVHAKNFDAQTVSRYSTGACYICEWLIELHHIDSNNLAANNAETKDPLSFIQRFSKCKEIQTEYPKFLKVASSKH